MIVDVKDVSKVFVQGEREVKVLSKVSFSMKEGESLSIVGPSGSGKTTLLSLLGGLDEPSQGSLDILGTSLGYLSESEKSRFRSQNIGIVFQQFHLMPYLTAEENVALPLDIAGVNHSIERAREILSEVGLDQRFDHLPHQLSGGERQRVAIARAYVVKPKLLLADEPSGNLDTETGVKVMDLLFSMVEKQKTSMILVTHDIELARRCHRSIQLMGGRVQ